MQKLISQVVVSAQCDILRSNLPVLFSKIELKWSKIEWSEAKIDAIWAEWVDSDL
jgi:hypothetical protein